MNPFLSLSSLYCLLRDPHWHHDCITSHLSCGHEIGTTAVLSEGVIFAKENRRNSWLQKLSEDPPETVASPAALQWTAELQMGLTLWLIKDLAGGSAAVPLTFKVWLWLHADSERLGIWRDGKLTNNFAGFASRQRWQTVNRENAISFVVNYRPTQSDTRQHKSSCSDCYFCCTQSTHLPRKVHTHTLHLCP